MGRVEKPAMFRSIKRNIARVLTILDEESKTMEKRVNRRKTLMGTVVSDKMQKTRVVKVVWVAKHAKYEKPVQHMVKYKAHDEKTTARSEIL